MGRSTLPISNVYTPRVSAWTAHNCKRQPTSATPASGLNTSHDKALHPLVPDHRSALTGARQHSYKHTQYIDHALLYRKRPQIQQPVTWPELCVPVRPVGLRRNKSPATSSGRSAGCSQVHSDWAQLRARRSRCIPIRKHPAQTINRATRKTQVTLHGPRDRAGQDRDRANAPHFLSLLARTPQHGIMVSTLPRQCRSQGFNMTLPIIPYFRFTMSALRVGGSLPAVFYS